MKFFKPPPGLIAEAENSFTRGQRNFLHFVLSVFRLYRSSIFACMLVILAHAGLALTPFFQRLENIAYDYFLRARADLHAHSDIVLIEIDETSVVALGQRWPWPRELQAALVYFLTEWGARAIVFDIIFSDPSSEFSDTAFKQALEKSQNVYFPVVLEGETGHKVWTHSLSDFEKSARGLGHINIEPDSDGTLRHIHPFLTGGSGTYPHLALKVAYDYLGKKIPGSAAELDLPLDAENRLVINWAGRWKETFIHYSFIQLMESFKNYQSDKHPRISPEKIKGKICIVGLSSTGYTDIKANPLEVTYPAVGLHANVINSILTNQFIRTPPKWIHALCVVLIGLLALVFFIPFRSLASVVIGILIVILWELFVFFLFADKGIWCAAVQPALVIPSLLIASAVCAMTVAKKEQKKLFKLATRDGLTGVYTIRHFKIMLNQYSLEALIKKEPVSLLLMDIDNFKHINDTYGHAAGDEVLRRLAEVLLLKTRQRRTLPESDVVARYGGEEFIIMLRKSSLTDACFKVAERIRKGVEEFAFMWEGKKLPVTISIGVATLRQHENVPDLMVRRADAALYRAKNSGKNRVCIESD